MQNRVDQLKCVATLSDSTSSRNDIIQAFKELKSKNRPRFARFTTNFFTGLLRLYADQDEALCAELFKYLRIIVFTRTPEGEGLNSINLSLSPSLAPIVESVLIHNTPQFNEATRNDLMCLVDALTHTSKEAAVTVMGYPGLLEFLEDSIQSSVVWAEPAAGTVHGIARFAPEHLRNLPNEDLSRLLDSLNSIVTRTSSESVEHIDAKAVQCAMAIAHLVGREEVGLFSQNKAILRMAALVLEASIEGKAIGGHQWGLEGVLSAVKQICTSDTNKAQMCDIPTFLDMLIGILTNIFCDAPEAKLVHARLATNTVLAKTRKSRFNLPDVLSLTLDNILCAVFVDHFLKRAKELKLTTILNLVSDPKYASLHSKAAEGTMKRLVWVIGDKQIGCLQALHNGTGGSSKRRMASRAGPEPSPRTSPSPSPHAPSPHAPSPSSIPNTPDSHRLGRQVMVSYNWAQQSTVKRIVAGLKQRGHTVWVDIEQMAGSTIEAMANAVETSAVMLMCVSEEYKESTNCRLEAEYAQQCKKPIVPVLLKSGYKPNGWLGLLMGSKLYYNLADHSTFEPTLASLSSATAALLPTPLQDSSRAPDKHHHTPVQTAHPSPDFEAWGVGEVGQWLDVVGMSAHRAKFEKAGLTGVGMIELSRLLESDQRAFIEILESKVGVGSLGDTLHIGYHLRLALSGR